MRTEKEIEKDTANKDLACFCWLPENPHLSSAALCAPALLTNSPPP